MKNMNKLFSITDWFLPRDLIVDGRLDLERLFCQPPENGKPAVVVSQLFFPDNDSFFRMQIPNQGDVRFFSFGKGYGSQSERDLRSFFNFKGDLNDLSGMYQVVLVQRGMFCSGIETDPRSSSSYIDEIDAYWRPISKKSPIY